MLDSEEYRELGNGKRYNPSIERKMSENGSTQENVTGTSSENVEGEISKIQTFKQEAVNEQIKRLIAPLTREIGELTRLTQRVVTKLHPSHYPRTDFGTSSITATFQSDTQK